MTKNACSFAKNFLILLLLQFFVLIKNLEINSDIKNKQVLLNTTEGPVGVS